MRLLMSHPLANNPAKLQSPTRKLRASQPASPPWVVEYSRSKERQFPPACVREASPPLRRAGQGWAVVCLSVRLTNA